MNVNAKLYIGNLPFNMGEDELKEIISEVGEVLNVSIPTDHTTGRRRGFAFVEMQSEEAAQEAIKKFDGQMIGNRQVVVNIARAKPPRRPGR